MAFAQTVFAGEPTPVDHDLVPSAVFTQPELGTVGMTEEEARDREEIEVYCTSFRPMRSAFAGAPDRALMKLVVSKASRRILGCHIVAPEAGRDDPARRHRGEDGGDERGFRPHLRRASDDGRGVGDYA